MHHKAVINDRQSTTFDVRNLTKPFQTIMNILFTFPYYNTLFDYAPQKFID